MGDAAMAERAMREKLRSLEELLRSWGRVAIGYSGGVDSTFLAAVCARAMPRDAVLVRLDTPFAGTPERESVAREIRAGGSSGAACGLPLVTMDMRPLDDALIARNGRDRCYYCKLAGFSAILAEARSRGISVVADGSNADDADDDRPGMRALRELGVRSPLMETGWRKDEERAVLRAWRVPVWDMPAGACLATRIPHGEPLTARKLSTVRACENYLRSLGLRQVRARLVEGCVHVEASPADLLEIGHMDVRRGDGPECGRPPHEEGERDAVRMPPVGSVALPESVVGRLAALSGGAVDPWARPYGRGGARSKQVVRSATMG